MRAPGLTIAVLWIIESVLGSGVTNVLLRPVGNYAQYLGLGGDLAIDGGNPAHFLHLASDPQRRYLEHQSVAGHDRTAELGILDGAKERNLARAVLKLTQDQYRTRL